MRENHVGDCHLKV